MDSNAAMAATTLRIRMIQLLSSGKPRVLSLLLDLFDYGTCRKQIRLPMPEMRTQRQTLSIVIFLYERKQISG